VRAEWLKLRTTPTVAGLAGAMLALVLFAVLLHGLSLPVRSVSDREAQLTNVFAWGELFSALFGGLLGALSVTGEFRHGTIRPALLVVPRRSRVLAFKVAVAVGVGAGFGLLAAAIDAGVGAIALSARGIDVGVDGGDLWRLALGAVVAGALWAALGVGLGALVRRQVPAIAGLCVWLLFIENLLVAFVPSVGRFGPGAAGGGVAGIDAETLLAPAAGAAVLMAYAAAALGAGGLAFARRDVN
jgi:ABC-2 type transport system permease protein